MCDLHAVTDTNIYPQKRTILTFNGRNMLYTNKKLSCLRETAQRPTDVGMTFKGHSFSSTIVPPDIAHTTSYLCFVFCSNDAYLAPFAGHYHSINCTGWLQKCATGQNALFSITNKDFYQNFRIYRGDFSAVPENFTEIFSLLQELQLFRISKLSRRNGQSPVVFNV